MWKCCLQNIKSFVFCLSNFTHQFACLFIYLSWLGSLCSSTWHNLIVSVLQCRRPRFDSWFGRSTGEGTGYPLQYSWAFLVAQLVKNPSTMQETWVWSLGWEDPLEKNGKDTHSSLPASKESGRTEQLSLSVFPGGSVVKKLPANARDVGMIPGLERPRGEEVLVAKLCRTLWYPMDHSLPGNFQKIPWKREWQTTHSSTLTWKFHGQTGPRLWQAMYSPWGAKSQTSLSNSTTTSCSCKDRWCFYSQVC